MAAPVPHFLQAQQTNFYDTPDIRIRIQTQMDKAAEERLADRAGPDAWKCLITLEEGEIQPLTIAHVVDRRLQNAKTYLFEYICGMKPQSFNTDSSSNVFYLRWDTHLGFDHFGWALLPDAEIMKEIHDFFMKLKAQPSQSKRQESSATAGAGEPTTEVNSSLPEQPDKSPFPHWKSYAWYARGRRYNYRVIPLRWHSDGTLVTRGRDVFYGGKGLPVLTSWIHPFAAIFNAGVKLEYLNSTKKNPFRPAYDLPPSAERDLAQMAWDIWTVWSKTPLPQSYRPPRDHSPTRGVSKGSGNGYMTRSSISAEAYASRNSGSADGSASAGVLGKRSISHAGNEGRSSKKAKPGNVGV